MSKLDTLSETLKLLRDLIGEDCAVHVAPEQKQDKYLIGEYVIVRCKDAGVHAGTLVDYNGREAVLKESRRLWYWVANQGHSLSAVAKHGIAEGSKIPAHVPTIVLTETCEIISASAEAKESIDGFKVYEEQ